MADTKITSLLTPQVTTNPATDVLPIVNIADTSMATSGSTRKITVNQLLGAGGTATLASATISGDLTVDTSTLKVDSANNRVGIGTAIPAVGFDVGYTESVFGSSTSSGYSILNLIGTGTGSARYGSIRKNYDSPFDLRIRASNSNSDAPIIFELSNASTAMTLNSTGLGVGVSPAYKLDVNGVINTSSDIYALGGRFALYRSAGSSYIDWSSGQSLIFRTVTSVGGAGASTIATIDSSGNVGIGVTPSYKLDTYTTLQGTVTAKQFANRTANKILVKRFFGITADTALFSVECGTAGAGAMAAFEINVFATGQKSGSSGDRQFYGKWYVTRNLAGTFTITSAFSSGSAGAFTVAASGTSLNVNGIFSVISDGSACVEVTGYIGGRDTVAETALTVTMP